MSVSEKWQIVKINNWNNCCCCCWLKWQDTKMFEDDEYLDSYSQVLPLPPRYRFRDLIWGESGHHGQNNDRYERQRQVYTLYNSLIFSCFEFLGPLPWSCKNESILLLNYLCNVNLYIKECLINCTLILFHPCP